MDCNPPESSVHGILQARIPERVAISFSRASSCPRGWTCVSCLAGKFFTTVQANSLVAQSCLTLCNPVVCSRPTRLLCPWNFPGKNTGVGCHFQEIFPIQGTNPCVLCLLHWQVDFSPVALLGELRGSLCDAGHDTSLLCCLNFLMHQSQAELVHHLN